MLNEIDTSVDSSIATDSNVDAQKRNRRESPILDVLDRTDEYGLNRLRDALEKSVENVTIGYNLAEMATLDCAIAVAALCRRARKGDYYDKVDLEKLLGSKLMSSLKKNGMELEPKHFKALFALDSHSAKSAGTRSRIILGADYLNKLHAKDDQQWLEAVWAINSMNELIALRRDGEAPAHQTMAAESKAKARTNLLVKRPGIATINSPAPVANAPAVGDIGITLTVGRDNGNVDVLGYVIGKDDERREEVKKLKARLINIMFEEQGYTKEQLAAEVKKLGGVA